MVQYAMSGILLISFVIVVTVTEVGGKESDFEELQ